MTEKQPHKPHTLGAPSSKEVPLRGIKPSHFPCPVCGKTFETHAEMQRHRDTMHHETRGHD